MPAPKEKTCLWKECDIVFTPKTHNMKYCSDEHLRLATNARIMEKYYERKDRRGGKKRVCDGLACTTVLSRYNEGRYCAKCESRKERDKNQKLLDVLTNGNL